MAGQPLIIMSETPAFAQSFCFLHEKRGFYPSLVFFHIQSAASVCNAFSFRIL